MTVWQTDEPGRVQDAVHVGQRGDDELHVRRQILGQPSINRPHVSLSCRDEFTSIFPLRFYQRHNKTN